MHFFLKNGPRTVSFYETPHRIVQAIKHIGDDVSEELEYTPAIFFVNQFIRPKYACPNAPIAE
jgi:hypothetical protein